jgi:hypothetical protein
MKIAVADRKTTFYREVIEENKSDGKKLYRIIGKLLRPPEGKNMPSCDNISELCEHFCEFYEDKINILRTKILNDLETQDNGIDSECRKVSRDTPIFNQFAHVSSEEIMKIGASLQNKTCLAN